MTLVHTAISWRGIAFFARLHIHRSLFYIQLTSKGIRDRLTVLTPSHSIDSCNLYFKEPALIVTRSRSVKILWHGCIYSQNDVSTAILDQYAVTQDTGLGVPSDIQWEWCWPGQAHDAGVQGCGSQARWSSKKAYRNTQFGHNFELWISMLGQ